MCSWAYPEAPLWPMLSTGASSGVVRAEAARPVEALKTGAAVGERRISSLHPTPVCEPPVLEGGALLLERCPQSSRTSLRRSFRYSSYNPSARYGSSLSGGFARSMRKCET